MLNKSVKTITIGFNRGLCQTGHMPMSSSRIQLQMAYK